MSNITVSNTPWETYTILETKVHVKRDDLSVTAPGPYYSKTRAVERLITRKYAEGVRTFAVIDDGHSVIGWATARICAEFGVPCHVYFSCYKHEILPDDTVQIRINQMQARKYGAELHALTATRFMIMQSRARAEFNEIDPNGYYIQTMPDFDNALIEVNAEEAALTPAAYQKGTWVLNVSKSTTACGIIKGLGQFPNIQFIIYMCDSKSKERLHSWMLDHIGFEPNWEFIDEGLYAYEDGVNGFNAPFQSSRYYDLKAYKWLSKRVRKLAQPIIFWNVGS